MAADGVRYDEIVAATAICQNKSSLATILANPIYRGVRVFNRETRVEGEHGRKRRRNPSDQLIESEVEPIVPEALWQRVQAMLVDRRVNRLPPQRLKGGRPDGAPPMRLRRRDGRHSLARASLLPLQDAVWPTDGSGRPPRVGDLRPVRRTLITADAVKQMVEILNADIELRRSRETGDREQAARQVRSLERQDANLRRALRTASAAAAERISVELDPVASELAQAKRRAEALDREVRPYRITAKLIQEVIDQMTGLLDHAPLETRVAWVRDLFEGIDVDGVQQRAIVRWKAPTDQDVDRLESVTEWLRRGGAGHLLRSRGTATEISLPQPSRSREWLSVGLVECARCHQMMERRPPIQRRCPACRAELKRMRSREAMARRRRLQSSS
jgi:hypothetical protein